MVKVGCCGFQKAKREYYRHFSLVEIQQTFYQPPQLKTAERWRREAPHNFEFTIKAWQLITHPPSSPTYRRLTTKIKNLGKYGFCQSTMEVHEAWQVTKETARALGVRWIVFQCPASFTPTREHIKNLQKFFAKIDRDRFLFAWEPRGKWDKEVVTRLCQELGLVHCVDPFQSLPITAGKAYFRLHGRGGYRYRYPADDLQKLQDWCQEYSEVYCLF
ncbi:MAG: DUF72 domain-containing protein, partial [Chloroflexi bacterium]|nr:DUF72 domain-containing protein [Chloroflexota bacterium]